MKKLLRQLQSSDIILLMSVLGVLGHELSQSFLHFTETNTTGIAFKLHQRLDQELRNLRLLMGDDVWARNVREDVFAETYAFASFIEFFNLKLLRTCK